MTTRSISAGIFIVLTVFACKHSKNTTTSASQNTVNKDTATAKESPGRYQEANPRSNDLVHTRLEVSFDWSTCRMNGKATLLIRPYFYPVEWMYLNAKGMDIKKLDVYTSTGDPSTTKSFSKEFAYPKIGEYVPAATFRYENDSIKISLGKSFDQNHPYYVVIEYVAKPNEITSGGSSAITDDKGLYFVNPNGENKFKMPQIWTQGETQASSAWFPTIDSPNEKMTQEILMTVDEKYTTLSNGTLTASQKNGNGTRTDHWKQTAPHAPYLAMMAVGEFVKITDEPWNGTEISYYVEKEYAPHAKAIFGETRQMIDFFSTRLGVPYAWPKYAQIAVRDYVSGAMENTSATLHGDFMVYQTERETRDEKKGNSVIAHELFHQWFGDLVTCESWSNLPLNESFATYGEYLWEEFHKGRDFADYHHYQSRQGYLHADKEKELIRYHYSAQEDMFDAFSYNKGGQVLHMLRKAVGDDAFFASLNHYLTTNRYKSVEIHNLRLSFEEVTGRDMNWFFNQWFFSKGRPKLKVSWKYDGSNVQLTVKQLQDLEKVPLYRLPLEVDFYLDNGNQRKHIEITKAEETFTLPSPSQPKLVNFDAERQLLCDLDFPKSVDEYIFQYKNAPLYDDRSEALKKLDTMLRNEKVFELVKSAATNDKFYAIANRSMGMMERSPAANLPVVKSTLIGIFNNKGLVSSSRARALDVLNSKFPGDAEVRGLNEKALGEESYLICGTALEALAKADPVFAMQKAVAFENEKGKDVIYPIAALYAEHGSDAQVAYFHNTIPFMNGFELLGFVMNYVKVAMRCRKPESVIAAANDFEMLSKGGNKYSKFATVKALKDLTAEFEKRERKAQTALEAAKKENQSTAAIELEIKNARELKETLNTMYSRAK